MLTIGARATGLTPRPRSTETARCTCWTSTSGSDTSVRACSSKLQGSCSPSLTGRRGILSSRRCKQGSIRVRAGPEQDQSQEYNKEFGYSRKDILLIGGGLLGLGLGSYYGLQAFGMEPGMAGNFVQFGIFVFFCVGYISSYLFRVLNKDMSYTKQLDQYEEAVMNKRLEEMPEAERERLYAEIEDERQKRLQKQQKS